MTSKIIHIGPDIEKHIKNKIKKWISRQGIVGISKNDYIESGVAKIIYLGCIDESSDKCMSFDVELFTLKKRVIIKYIRNKSRDSWSFLSNE